MLIIIIQVIMVGLVIAFPSLIEAGLDRGQKFDLDKVKIEIPAFENNDVAPPFGNQNDDSANDIMKQLQQK